MIFKMPKERVSWAEMLNVLTNSEPKRKIAVERATETDRNRNSRFGRSADIRIREWIFLNWWITSKCKRRFKKQKLSAHLLDKFRLRILLPQRHRGTEIFNQNIEMFRSKPKVNLYFILLLKFLCVSVSLW
jgi:hypothetical protein